MTSESRAWELLEALEAGVEVQTHRALDRDELGGYAYAARLLRAIARMRQGRDIENAIQAIEFIASNPTVRTVLKTNGEHEQDAPPDTIPSPPKEPSQ